MLKYQTYKIVFQEIPNEITFAVFLSHCPNKCNGCHSPHLWKDEGTILDVIQIENWIERYKNGISCFCFMGGDSDPDTIQSMSSFIKGKYGHFIKTAWYSGKNKLPENCSIQNFNYIKLGQYMSLLGGLDSVTTNQRLYYIENNKMLDITYLFQKQFINE